VLRLALACAYKRHQSRHQLQLALSHSGKEVHASLFAGWPLWLAQPVAP